MRAIAIGVLLLSGLSGCRSGAEQRRTDAVAVAPRESAPERHPPPSPPSAAPSASASAPAPAVVAPPPEASPPLPRALVSAPPRPGKIDAGLAGPVDPEGDGAWLARLASAPIAQAKRNRGGATITVRLRFADGQRAVFKPEQTHSAGNFRAEIAAYHLDRLLGFGRTAPVAGRRVGLAWLRQSLVASGADAAWMARFDKEVRAHDGRVAGAVIGWRAGRLVPIDPPRGWTTSDNPRVPAWSDMVVFDFLIDNTDRYSGGNVLSLGKGGKLIFLDNAAGFADARMKAGYALGKMLGPLCRFRRATIAALRANAQLGEALEASLAKDPLAPVLDERHFAALDARVAKLLAHVDGCIAEQGEGAVLLGDATGKRSAP